MYPSTDPADRNAEQADPFTAELADALQQAAQSALDDTGPTVVYVEADEHGDLTAHLGHLPAHDGWYRSKVDVIDVYDVTGDSDGIEWLATAPNAGHELARDLATEITHKAAR